MFFVLGKNYVLDTVLSTNYHRMVDNSLVIATVTSWIGPISQNVARATNGLFVCALCPQKRT